MSCLSQSPIHVGQAPAGRSLPCVSVVVAAMLVFGFATPTLAQPTSARKVSTREITPKSGTSTTARPADRISGSNWWSTVGSLALVIAAILVLGVLFKAQYPGARGLLPKTVLQDLGRRPLDPRNSIHLVRCGSKILVLGVSPAGMSALGEITDPIEVDSLTGLCQPQSDDPDQQPFGQLLRRMLGTVEPSTAETQSEPADPASERLKSRLQSFATPGPVMDEVAHG